MMDRIDDFPAPDLPISKTFRCLWRLLLRSIVLIFSCNVCGFLIYVEQQSPPVRARALVGAVISVEKRRVSECVSRLQKATKDGMG